jgi:flagellar biosynthesis/type III secretory pathway protein FliH
MASLTVLMMVHARRCTAAELTEAVQRWGHQITAILDLHGQERVLVLWSYLFQTTEVAPERVAAALRDAQDDRIQETLMSTAVRLRKEGLIRGRSEGLAEGLAQGLVQGLVQGRAEMLLHQLTRRFGPLSAEIVTRVRTATTPDLERWADAVLTVPTLERVFAG